MAYFVVATNGVPELWGALETADLVLSEKDGPPARSIGNFKEAKCFVTLL